ncbi:hypothetical protein B0H15DRAFT_865431 [Mycena belliarum]|uniref:Uncharacterized protein n=1 Tax=Mycena belliarum TaxID=1033014 RepID=A0AAD6XHV7_9AGAR|nr:hypothetical protein B0H15DRAFT_865431 [Mycena belliae]
MRLDRFECEVSILRLDAEQDREVECRSDTDRLQSATMCDQKHAVPPKRRGKYKRLQILSATSSFLSSTLSPSPTFHRSPLGSSLGNPFVHPFALRSLTTLKKASRCHHCHFSCSPYFPSSGEVADSHLSWSATLARRSNGDLSRRCSGLVGKGARPRPFYGSSRPRVGACLRQTDFWGARSRQSYECGSKPRAGAAPARQTTGGACSRPSCDHPLGGSRPQWETAQDRQRGESAQDHRKNAPQDVAPKTPGNTQRVSPLVLVLFF